MSSVNLPSTLSVDEHGSHTQQIDNPDLVASQLQEAAFQPDPVQENVFRKKKRTKYDEKDYLIAKAEIDNRNSELEITARDHVGVTPLTPSSSLEIKPKIDWNEVFNVFLEVHRYKRTFNYQGVPIENFLNDDKDLTDVYLIVAANYIESLKPIFRQGVIRTFDSQRVDAVDAHGRIDIKRSIWNYKSGTPKQHFVTKEPNYNIPVNSLIHLAGKYLLALFRRYEPNNPHQGYYSIFSEVQEKVRYLEERDISSSSSDIREYSQITVGSLPPQRAYYQRAIEISKTILSSAIGEPMTGGEKHLTMDYLINMDSLFQEYSQIVLERQIDKISSELTDESDIEIRNEEKTSPYSDIDTHIRPDHLLVKDNDIISILDTKYYSGGVNPVRNLENRNQMYRYSTILNVDEMVFLCPETKPVEHKITPSGKVMKVVSPTDFTTENYEASIREYLEDTFNLSTIEKELFEKIEQGHICGIGAPNRAPSEILSMPELSLPINKSFLREIQKDFIKIDDSLPKFAYIRRKYGFRNPFYQNIRDAIDSPPDWANLIIPLKLEVQNDGELENHLHIQYVAKSENSIDKIDQKCIPIPAKWQQ
ncbi:5-methylcytosine restriction system specificity protein McrC [Halorussus salinus]|uniref:5-methylcytosine restriction system specificity protein McrC n=1 Tax=Halorussus salinus TaxID=1364935 RepID=UPI00109250A5|nr:hypothetical protein [Halorussus salinus]